MMRFLLMLLTVAVAGSCGEPFVVLGDAPGLMRIVLGVGDSIGTRVDSIAVRTKLTDPTSVVFDPARALLYVSDRGGRRQVGGVTTPVARLFSVTSNGRARMLFDGGGCAGGVCVVQPTAMALAPDGALIIADAVGHRVLRYLPSGGLSVIAGTGAAGVGPDGVPATQSPLLRPSGVAVAGNGTVYIAEAGSHRVRVIGPDGNLRTAAGTGVPGHGGDAGPAAAALLHEPTGLAFHDGVLYVSEFLGSVVRMIDEAGVIRTIAGVPGSPGFSGDGGPALEAHLNRPFALTITPDGRTLFISDQANERVRAVDLTTGSITTFAGTGSRTWTGNRRVAGETSLASPAGLDAVNGFLFIADRGHSVIWRTSIAVN